MLRKVCTKDTKIFDCKVRLPNTEDITKEFGVCPFKNQLSHVAGENAFALASVLYDVENRIALDVILAPIRKSEKDLAIVHLAHIQQDDLIICDRGYGSYELIAEILKNKGHFVIRLSTRTFKQANAMYRDTTKHDVVTTIHPQPELVRKITRGYLSLPNKIPIRFVKVLLDTGEIEILATSLVDQTTYPRSLFKELYWKRWGG